MQLVRRVHQQHVPLPPKVGVHAPGEVPVDDAGDPVADASEGMHLPLTDGEKKLIAFLVEMAVKSWKPAP